jgi:hypothetical protein
MNKSNGNSRNCYQANAFRSRRRIIAPYIRLPALYSGFHNILTMKITLNVDSNNRRENLLRRYHYLQLSYRHLAVMEHHQSCSEIKIPTESNNT